MSDELINIEGIAAVIADAPPRVAMLRALQEICRRARSGKYYVRRGPINWAVHDFAAMPLAISILTPEFTLFGNQYGLDISTVSLELGMEMPGADDGRGEDPDGLDDASIEGLIVDAGRIIKTLAEVKWPNGDPVVMRLVVSDADSSPVNGQEFASDDWRVQGVLLTFTVEH